MYSQQAAMTPQKPETFMLSTEAQQALPHDAQVALQQVDNRESTTRANCLRVRAANNFNSKILPNLCPRRLAARSVHPTVSPANWRIRLLRSLVGND